MNKIANYLNEHLLGEVTSAKSVRKHYSTDASVLNITPEVVVLPRSTSDIRKVARFSWQLAEKGHVVSITARGLGNDTTGAAIGKGIVISVANHLNDILEIAPKDRLIHLQAGVQIKTLQQTLQWQGLTISDIDPNITVGGAIASNAHSSFDTIGDSIEKLEIVLANGDILETGRISKREVNRKLGLQTLEGEIYRKLSGLIEDNESLIEKIASNSKQTSIGYSRIAEVKQKDGSFDLTPLFIGSQGTLGIISEAVLRADFYSSDQTIVAIITDSLEQAGEVADKISKSSPTEATIYDGNLFKRAGDEGVRFSILKDVGEIGAIVYVRFNDFSSRAQAQKLKKLKKALKNEKVTIISSVEKDIEDFAAIPAVTYNIVHNDKEANAIPLLDGAYIPHGRRAEFESDLEQLAAKHHLELPVVVNTITGTYRTFPELKLNVVSDKQKLFRLITDFAALIDSHNGAFVSEGGEGRLKANAAWGLLSEEEKELYAEIRKAFDPFGTLNAGVKQPNEIRSLVAALRTTYDNIQQLK